MQDSVGQVNATRTISTEQWARAATADDTLPVRSLSTLPTPLAPTKMQSAFQPSASLSNRAFGSSSFTTTEVRSPVCLSFSEAITNQYFHPLFHPNTSLPAPPLNLPPLRSDFKSVLGKD